MVQVAGLVLPLFVLIALGFAAGRIWKISIDGLAWLNVFLLYFSLPALFFRLLANTPIEQFHHTAFLVRAALGTLIIFGLCFCIARLIRRATIPASTIQGFAGAYGNIGYLGPPLAIAAFGPEAGVPVALIFCIDNSMHFTLGPLLMGLGEPRRRSLVTQVGQIVQRIITHPFILATIAGITAASLQWSIPVPVDTFLQMLSGAAAPCALFAMGVTASLRPLKRVPPELAYLVPVKLLVHPLLMYFLLKPVEGLDEIWLYSAVLLAALPAATNVFVIAQQYQVWEERASSAVVVSTFFSLFTVTGFIYAVRQGLL